MNFEPLIPADLPRLKKYFAFQRYEMCAYSLSSMLVWSNESYQTCGAATPEALLVCVRFSDKQRSPHLVLPVCPSREFSPEELADLAASTGIGNIHFVPRDYITRYGRERLESLFKVRSHVEYHDYIYNTSDLAQLAGNKYSKKRNLINQFHRDFVADGKAEVQPLAAAHAPACLDFLEEWCLQRDCGREEDEDDLACEKRAVQNALNYWDSLEFKGLVVLMNGEVRAFGIGAQLTEDMGNLNFEKADASVKGLYQFLDRECARHLFPGCLFINKESDMNLPGLAKAKQSYHPIRMVHAYKLALR